VWCVLWLAWSSFIICFYLDVGLFDKEKSIAVLNLGISHHHSWWKGYLEQWHHTGDSSLESNGTLGVNSSEPTVTAGVEQSSPSSLLGSVLTYYYIEVLHAAVQSILAIIGVIVACIVVHIFTEEDDSSEPVRGELEYIKMRYHSPARQSFRTQKKYNEASRSNTLDRILPKSRSNRQSRRSDDPPPGLTDITGGGDVSPATPLKMQAQGQ